MMLFIYLLLFISFSYYYIHSFTHHFLTQLELTTARVSGSSNVAVAGPAGSVALLGERLSGALFGNAHCSVLHVLVAHHPGGKLALRFLEASARASVQSVNLDEHHDVSGGYSDETKSGQEHENTRHNICQTLCGHHLKEQN